MTEAFVTTFNCDSNLLQDLECGSTSHLMLRSFSLLCLLVLIIQSYVNILFYNNRNFLSFDKMSMYENQVNTYIAHMLERLLIVCCVVFQLQTAMLISSLLLCIY